MRPIRTFRLAALAATMCLAQAAIAVTTPSVKFDVSSTVSCRDVTPESFAAEYPAERLIEATIRVSALVARGDERRFSESVYHFFAPDRRVTVHDYLPKTELVTPIVGNIDVRQGDDATQTSQLSLGASYENLVRGDVTAGSNRSRSHSLLYEMLPPQETLSTAGTMSRESGVYFKLRSTTRTTLEGSHDFVILFRVPNNWSVDHLRAICQARDSAGNVIGQASYLVALHRGGDVRAKSMADELHDQEQQLIATANLYQKAVRRASQPTLAHELSLRPPEIPRDWLTQIVISPSTRKQSFEPLLPVAVQSAIQSYRLSRQAVPRGTGSAISPSAAQSLTQVAASHPAAGEVVPTHPAVD